MEYSRNQKILWAVGTVVVLFYALIPVAWIMSLSLKDAGDDRRPEVLPDRA